MRCDVNTSDSERSTGEVVREIIERDGTIRIGLARKLINARALARYIQVATHEKYSFEALVSAIRRYPVHEIASQYQETGKLITKLTMKNNIVAVSIRSVPEAPAILAKVSGEIDYGRGETFRIVSGPESVSVIIDSKNLAKVTAAVPKRDIVRVLDNLSELIVVLSDTALRTVGIAATLATELAMNRVNILYTMSYGPPHAIVYIVDDVESLSGYRAFQRLSRGQI